jgi:hypothetical protein
MAGYEELDTAHLIRERETLRQLIDKCKVEQARLQAAYDQLSKVLDG